MCTLETLVLMEGIDKSFPGVKALNQAKFELRFGEVHALVGENGAGKSTLMKILAGLYKKDAGSIVYKGHEVEIPNPKAAQSLGINIIHQEFNLMPHLTVAQNIFIGHEPRKSNRFFLDERRANEEAEQLFRRMQVDIDPRTQISKLTVAHQQLVEIAKALSFNSEVIIMDEPTAALSEEEIQNLFRIIRELRNKGTGIVYISHRLDELRQICDRVTVMRDGHYVDTSNMQDVTKDQIIDMMVGGRPIYDKSPQIPQGASQEDVLEVKNLNRGNAIKGVSFSLKKGEILGFAGLMGAGRTEVARAIFGADPIDSGEIYVNGRKVHIRSPKDAVECGIGYLSEDRKRYGLALDMNVKDNVVLSSLRRLLGLLGFIKQDDESKIAEDYVDALGIKTPSIKQVVRNLSGGNQQKVVIGKWLVGQSNILIFDEPTRGIDVGAKGEIYKLLDDLTKQGKSIIMISSELPEILRMSHRVVVMCEGRITGELAASEATQQRIMQLSTQH